MEPSKIGNLFKAIETKTESCERHGDYTASLHRIPGKEQTSWSECPQCFQEKRRLEDMELVQQAARDANDRRMEKMLGHAAIPKRYTECRFESYIADNDGQRKALSSSTRYAADLKDNIEQGRCLIMVGNPGTGKTHLAIAIAHAAIDQGFGAVYVTVNEFIDAIIESYGERGKRQTLKTFREPEILVLDEVGRQKGSDHDRSMMFELISRRYDDMKPTILISNLNLIDFKKYLDQATYDRLRDKDGRVIIFDWESHRG